MTDRIDVAIEVFGRIEQLEARVGKLESLVVRLATKAGMVPPEEETRVSAPVRQVAYGGRCDELRRQLREKLAQGADMGRSWDLVDAVIVQTAQEEFGRNDQRRGSVRGFRQYIEDGLIEEAA